MTRRLPLRDHPDWLEPAPRRDREQLGRDEHGGTRRVPVRYDDDTPDDEDVDPGERVR